MNEFPAETPAPASVTERALRMLILGVLLAAAWLVWSGFFKPLLLSLGAFSCALVLYISHRMHLFDTEVYGLRFGLRLIRFWGWLGIQIVRSSIEVTRLVLNPRAPISPTVVEFEAGSSHPVDKATLGNSITLTPGTLTINIEGGRLTVHALTRRGAEQLLAGEMNRRVSALRRN